MSPPLFGNFSVSSRFGTCKLSILLINWYFRGQSGQNLEWRSYGEIDKYTGFIPSKGKIY